MNLYAWANQQVNEKQEVDACLKGRISGLQLIIRKSFEKSSSDKKKKKNQVPFVKRINNYHNFYITG